MAYRTTDLNVSAFLIATGNKLIGIEGEGQRKMFLFNDDARGRVDVYFMGGLCAAKDFAAALKMLKDALHADRDWTSRRPVGT
jgi:uncharacterized protein DUF5659